MLQLSNVLVPRKNANGMFIVLICREVMATKENNK